MSAAAPFPATVVQREVLRFICGYQLAHDGVSPSLAEIREGCGYCKSSKSQVSRVLASLEQRGWIRRLKRRARAIEVLVPLPVPGWPSRPLYAVRLTGRLAQPQPEYAA